MSLAEAEAMGGCLVVVASQEARTRTLLGPLYSPLESQVVVCVYVYTLCVCVCVWTGV